MGAARRLLFDGDAGERDETNRAARLRLSMMKNHKDLPVRVGVFSRLELADRAVDSLLDAGFDREHITVICPTCSADALPGVKHEDPAGAHMPQAAASGGAIGAVLGGLAAIIGVTTTGGLGLLVVGPMLLGMGGGAVAGGLVGAMMSRGFDDQIANYYDQAVEKGHILVAAEDHGPDAQAHLTEAEHIFARLGVDPLPLPAG